jgi:hypothetical protein
MSNFITWVLALAVSLGTTAALAVHYPGSQPGRASESQLALDGAYRDGLYVGKLAAESGRRSRAPIGRWSSERDRAAFLAGYESTYNARINQPANTKSELTNE